MSSDEDLVVLAVADRDREAFGELVRRHQGRVRGWLRSLTGDPALADDIAQESFIRAWHRLHSFAGKGRFSAWLMKLTYNEYLQAMRHSQRTRKLAERFGNERGHASATHLESELPDLPRFLSVLSADEKTVMILVHAFGLSHSEASEVIGMPLGTVKSHVRRGTRKVRAHFDLEETVHDTN